MAYPARSLISQAYNLSKIKARTFETVEGQDYEDGLIWLNEILSEQSINTRLLPYYTEYNVTAVVDQEAYFIPGLVEPVSFTYYLDTGKSIRYSCAPSDRNSYNATPRVDTVTSLPFKYNFERAMGPDGFGNQVEGHYLKLYFFPSSAFPLVIWGKFALPAVTDGTDLSLTMPPYLRKYLRYRLAQEICSENGRPFPDDAKQTLMELEASLEGMNPMDVRTKHVNLLGRNKTINYAQANLGVGYTASGEFYDI